MATSNVKGIAGLGYRLKKARFALSGLRVEKVTQADLGEAVGVTEGAYGHWENGRGFPDLPTAVRLAELLGVTPVWLVFGEGMEQSGRAAALGERAQHRIPASGLIAGRNRTIQTAPRRSKKTPRE